MKSKASTSVSFGVYRLSNKPVSDDRRVDPADNINAAGRERPQHNDAHKERRSQPERRRQDRRSGRRSVLLDTRSQKDRRVQNRRTSDRERFETTDNQRIAEGIDILV